MPNGHGLVETHHPRGDEAISHVLAPGPDHLPDLPELVAIRRRDGVCEDEALRNCHKPPFRHVPFEVVRAGAVLLWFRHSVVALILLH
jgi:hypothetical protein